MTGDMCVDVFGDFFFLDLVSLIFYVQLFKYFTFSMVLFFSLYRIRYICNHTYKPYDSTKSKLLYIPVVVVVVVAI